MTTYVVTRGLESLCELYITRIFEIPFDLCSYKKYEILSVLRGYKDCMLVM